MGDFLKSTFGNYFGSSSSGNKENEFIGQTIEVGKQVYRIRKFIAEGGYAIVFDGYDTAKGRSVAIKRLIAHDEDTCKVVMNEIEVLKKLNGHKNIIQFYNVAVAGKAKFKHIGTEFLIVTELCSGGGLQDYLPPLNQPKTLPSSIVLQILAQTSSAVQHMHKQSPPIIHRDLKVENLLLSDKFTIKLCDFGSASTQTHIPTTSWSALERGRVQEELERVTTPMYRAPEMLDLYLNYPINENLDIWALGCIFFYMVCGFHPFADSAKLAILNANFNLPPCSPETEPFHNLIRQMLLVDPNQRPNITTICGELSDLAKTRNVAASDSIIFNDDVKRRLNATTQRTATPSAAAATAQKPVIPVTRPPRPSPSAVASVVGAKRTDPPPPTSNQTASPKSVNTSNQHQNVPRTWPHHSTVGSPNSEVAQTASTSSTASSVFGFLKGSAGHIIKNIREASSKVIESVSAAMPSDLDLQYITSRIAVMSFPAESGLEVFGTRNSMEEAQNYLDKNHPTNYAVYNVSPRGYRSDQWFGGRVSHRPLETNRGLSLRSLVELCQNARLWLSQKPDKVCVIHCTDGRQLSGVFVCCLLCFCNVFNNAQQAIDFFISKRGPVTFTSSQIRYIDYVASLVTSLPVTPHNHPLVLFSITLTPIPTFNRLKNGCRPYVDVYQDGKKVYSSLIDYDSLRTYFLEDRRMEMILNGISVYGDILIVVSHARSLFAGKGNASATMICQIQFHTGFIDKKMEKISFMKNAMDHLYPSSNPLTSRYANSFHASLHLMVSPHEKPRQGTTLVYPWETLPPKASRRPHLCFSDEFEMRNVMPQGVLGKDGENDLIQQPTPSAPKASTLAEPSGSSSDEEEEKAADIVGPAHPEVLINDHIGDGSLAGSSAAEDDDGSAAEKAEKSTEDRDYTPPQNEMLIEGLDWSQAPTGLPQHFTDKEPIKKAVPVDASVGDLLGFSSQTSSPSTNHRSTPQKEQQEKSAGDWERLSDSMGESLNDVFSKSPTTATRTDPWLHSDGPGAGITSTAPNHNPFDPFGTATCPPEDFNPFTSQQSPASPFMHQSNSTSNLSAGSNVQSSPSIPQSASSSNLGPQPTAANYQSPKNPFEEFDIYFGQAAYAAKKQTHNFSPTHKPQTASGRPDFVFPPPPAQSTGAPRPTATSNATPRPTAHPTADFYSNSTTASPHHRASPPSGDGSFWTRTPPRTGTGPKISKNAFADLLGEFGADRPEEPQAPKTMAQMQREKLVDSTDPDVLKVTEWSEGKRNNVRALLCSLPAVTWDGVRWPQISMADVMTVKQVKQQYRKAARAVHPDKWMNTEYENLAVLVLTELNNAMAEFERLEQSA